MVIWPAVLKCAGEQELTFIEDVSAWNGDADNHFFGYQPGDILVDSAGVIFDLSHQENNITSLKSNGQVMVLADLLELIQAHESQRGSCCAAKLSFPSVAAAIKAIDDTGEAP